VSADGPASAPPLRGRRRCAAGGRRNLYIRTQPTNFSQLCILNHANTVSVEGNSRKRSYSHSHANMTVTETTASLQAWCGDNKNVRAVA
jgi:hypothetical protein